MPVASRLRADLLLVERGLFETRSRAREAIEAGLVTVDGACVEKPAQLIADGAVLLAERPHPWVSRGGVKLAAALDAFAIDPAGLICLDIGASTGGFTDVLLARGAAHVSAVDVGHRQLHPRLAADPRVTAREGTDARHLTGLIAPGSVNLVTVDVSFISLRLVLPHLTPLLAAGGRLVALVKPQFEVGRQGVGRGGIVGDPALRQVAVEGVCERLASLGLKVLGGVDSPITGRDGNAEFLVGARHG